MPIGPPDLTNAKKTDALLDAILDIVVAKIEKVNGRPLSDDAKSGLRDLQPATLAEMARLTEPATPTTASAHAPAPINIRDRIVESRQPKDRVAILKKFNPTSHPIQEN